MDEQACENTGGCEARGAACRDLVDQGDGSLEGAEIRPYSVKSDATCREQGLNWAILELRGSRQSRTSSTVHAVCLFPGPVRSGSLPITTSPGTADRHASCGVVPIPIDLAPGECGFWEAPKHRRQPYDAICHPLHA
jgi:hypothetical protein